MSSQTATPGSIAFHGYHGAPFPGAGPRWEGIGKVARQRWESAAAALLARLPPEDTGGVPHWPAPPVAVAILLDENDDPDRLAKRRRLFTDMVACFASFNIRIVGAKFSALVIRNAAHPYGNEWMLADNGGELTVVCVNDATDATHRSPPYTHWGVVVDGATLAYRVRCCLDGAEIDYERSLADQLDALRSGKPAPGEPGSP